MPTNVFLDAVTAVRQWREDYNNNAGEGNGFREDHALGDGSLSWSKSSAPAAHIKVTPEPKDGIRFTIEVSDEPGVETPIYEMFRGPISIAPTNKSPESYLSAGKPYSSVSEALQEPLLDLVKRLRRPRS